MRYFYFILGVIFIINDLVAQEYSIRNLSKINGLSNNYVTDIVQDRQGFIWIGTEAGLSRFDGQNFTNYNTTNSNLRNASINTLLYDKEDNSLWIGTKENLSILDCLTLKVRNYSEFDGIPLSNVVHLAHGENEKIWITNIYRGIVCYDKKTKRAAHFSNKRMKGMAEVNYCTFYDKKKNLYIGTQKEGLTIVDLTNNTFRHFRHDPLNPRSLPSNMVHAISSDRQGNIWIGTDQGLALFNPGKKEFTVFRHDPGNPYSLIGNNIYRICEMNDGALWVAADMEGISILNLYDINHSLPGNVRFTNISPADNSNNLSSGNIRSLLQDSFGNIWIGNSRSGVDFISHIPPVFHVLPYNYLEKGRHIENKPVWGVFADSKNQVWAGSDYEVALFRNNKLCGTFDVLHQQTPILSIMGDSRGNVFFGAMKDGFVRFDNMAKRFEKIAWTSSNPSIYTFFEESSGKVWIGTGLGIYSYSDGKVWKESAVSDQLTAPSVYGIRRDRQGKLWVGVYGAGVFVFNTQEKLVARLTSGNGFFSDAISSLIIDSRGGMWVGSRNAGFGYIPDTKKPGNFRKYSIREGLNDLFVRAIQEDKSGNIWFSTNSGISCWNRTTQKINNYDYHDGIPIGNFIEGSATSGSDGTIYFGSLNGVCYFKPQDVILKYKIAPIQIIECKGFNTQIENKVGKLLIPSNHGIIELRHSQNSFRVSFVVPDYAQSQRVEYAYMMDGLQNVWSNTSGDNQVTFRNISPGTYTFKVKARLKNQDWDEENIASLRIHISPPVWLSWYAQLFYFFIVCTVVYFIIRSYKRRLELRSFLEIERRNILNEQSLNQERLRFYTNITHELRTPLTLILGPLEDLKNDKKLPEYYGKKIQLIYNSAVSLLNLITQILEFRKAETQNRKFTVAKGDIAVLVKEIGISYIELNQNSKVKIHINIETDQTVIYFDADIISSILNNLLSNAVKYTPEGEIILTLSRVTESGADYIEIRVTDTGYGIDAEALPRIFDRYYQAKGRHQASGTGIGLAIVKSLADLHEGILNVESKSGKGSTFSLRLLKNNSYPHALHLEEGTKDKYLKQEAQESQTNDSPDSLMILVVEDNSDIREYVSSSLSEEYIVVTAENGKVGLLLAQEKIPNIIISDIMMPEMDGIEFCKLIKEDVKTSHIPVILLTAKDSIPDKEKGYESGADSYITKPFSINLLKKRMQNLLDNRHRLAKQALSDTKEISSSFVNSLDTRFLQQLTGLISENIDRPQLDIVFLRERMNMSYTPFYRKVKALTSLSPNEYIRKIRLKKSTELLLLGLYNISEVAYMVGFNDIPYFRRCFKEEYGVSPTEYIKSKKS